MKLTITLLLSLTPLAAALLPFSAAESGAPSSAREGESLIDQLDWMAGRWIIDEGGQYLEETWGPAREDAMVGSLRWARQDKVWLYELMSIEEDEELGLVFRLRHFSRNLEPWKSEVEGPMTFPLFNIEDQRVVFENPESDHPRRMVYQRSGDTLTIRLEDAEGNDDNPFRFRLDG